MPALLDPRSLVIYDCPREWPTVPEELIVKLCPQPQNIVRDQFGKVHYFRTPPMLSPEQKILMDKIAASRYFLIKLHEDCICGKCGGKHGYVTVGCVEAPFNGLTDITTQIVGKPWETFGLSKQERKEIDPGTSLRVPWHTVQIGDIVPITEAQARIRYERIRMKGIPWR